MANSQKGNKKLLIGIAILAIMVLVIILTVLWDKLFPTPTPGFCGSSTNGPCMSDIDCVTDGCSGQVCRSRAEEPILTTCELKECYDETKYGLACGCAAGHCRWKGI